MGEGGGGWGDNSHPAKGSSRGCEGVPLGHTTTVALHSGVMSSPVTLPSSLVSTLHAAMQGSHSMTWGMAAWEKQVLSGCLNQVVQEGRKALRISMPYTRYGGA